MKSFGIAMKQTRETHDPYLSQEGLAMRIRKRFPITPTSLKTLQGLEQHPERTASPKTMHHVKTVLPELGSRLVD